MSYSISVAHSHLTTLVLRFLEHHRYFNAMRALELETGKRADTSYGADLEFFRDLLLDGAWADAEDFIEPLEAHDEFNYRESLKWIRQQRFLEMLSKRSSESEEDGGGADLASAAESKAELVDAIKSLEGLCTRTELNSLTYCLGIGSVTDHPQFRDWTPLAGRLRCFEELRLNLESVFPSPSSNAGAPEQWRDEPEGLKELATLAGMWVRRASGAEGAAAEAEARSDAGPVWFDPVSLSATSRSAPRPSASPARGSGSGGNGDPASSSPSQSNARNHRMRASAAAVVRPTRDAAFGAGRGEAAAAAVRHSHAGFSRSYSSKAAAAGRRSRSPRARATGGVGKSPSSARDVLDWADEEEEEGAVAAASAVMEEETEAKEETEEFVRVSAPRGLPSKWDAVAPMAPVAPVAWEIGAATEEGKRRRRSSSSSSRSGGARGNDRGPPAGVVRRRAEMERRAASSREAAAAVEPLEDLDVRRSASPLAAAPPTVARAHAREPPLAPLRFAPLCHLLSEATAVRALAWVDAGDSALLLVGTNARKLRVVRAPDGIVASEREGHHAGSIYCVAAAVSGTTVLAATGSNDKLVKLITLGIGGRDGEGRVEVTSRLGLDMVLRGHTGTVRTVCFDGSDAEQLDAWSSPSQGRRLLSAGAGTFAVRLWSLDEAGGRQAAELKGHTAAVFELRARRSGRRGVDARIASASADGTVRLWDIRQKRSTLTLDGLGSTVCSVALPPTEDGLLAIGCTDGTAMLVDTVGGRVQRRLVFHKHEVRSLDFSQDGRRLFTSSFDGALAVWHVDDAAGVTPATSLLDAHRNKILQVRTAPRESSVPRGSFVSSDASGVVTMWRPT